MEGYILYIIGAAAGGFLLGFALSLLLSRKPNKERETLILELEKANNKLIELKNKLVESNAALIREQQLNQEKMLFLNSEKGSMVKEIQQLKEHNQEIDRLLKEGQPVIHSLKLKLIEANNTIARYKAQLGLKD